MSTAFTVSPAPIAYLERRSEEVKRYRARDIERLQLLKIQLGTAESPTTKVQ